MQQMCVCAKGGVRTSTSKAVFILSNGAREFTSHGMAWHGGRLCIEGGVRTSAAKIVVVPHNGPGIPVQAAAVLVPDAPAVLVGGAAVVQHAVPQHLQPAALQLCHAPAPSTCMLHRLF